MFGTGQLERSATKPLIFRSDWPWIYYIAKICCRLALQSKSVPNTGSEPQVFDIQFDEVSFQQQNRGILCSQPKPDKNFSRPADPPGLYQRTQRHDLNPTDRDGYIPSILFYGHRSMRGYGNRQHIFRSR